MTTTIDPIDPIDPIDSGDSAGIGLPIVPAAEPVRKGRGRARGAKVGRSVLPPLVVGSLLIGIWYFISYAVLDPKRRFLLEPPHKVWRNGFANAAARQEMFSALWLTTKVALWGLTLAVTIGFVIAIIMSQSKMLERGIYPYLVILQATPLLALVPLIGFWFGYGLGSRVLITVLIAVFPIIANTLFGLVSADQGMHDVLTLHNAGRITRLRKVQFPAALPAIFTGLRISAGLCVIGAIVGDFLFGQGKPGIGQLLKRYASRLEGEKLLSAVGLSCAMGVSVFIAFGWLSSRVVGRWATSTRTGK